MFVNSQGSADWHIQTFKYIIGVFATAVCSDQEMRNQRDQEIFFLKGKAKAGQKSDGVSSRLLESEESGASYNYLSGLEVQEK